MTKMTDVSCIVEGDGDGDSKIRDGQQLKNDDGGDGGNLNSRPTTPLEETKPLSSTTTTMTAMTANEPNPSKTLAPFNPSSQQIIDMALDTLDLNPNDVVFDIGCGDGRFLIEAVKHYEGLRCIGIEIDKVFVERARQTIANDLSPLERSKIEIRHEDALQLLVDGGGGGDLCENDKDPVATTATKQISELTLLDDATVLYLFVLPKGIVKLTPLLIEMVERRRKNRSCSSKSNSQSNSLRILSYMFKLHDWEPTKVDRTAKGGLPVYYYEF
eukprot:CAMPEP_0113458530 /NCGR_PEP_ID=MMETSP0014_2-20120614/9971_1 /TAXON_ID=2857 /ORGANISM="Nitzschia sp." /LENGTH=271 /DNA_ID=CAMNT_0000350059 /DNA_START=1512 /DNA_END=2327 /DNA_ORIENTATION=- /assembly_acc=CAM_ASM_000159